MVSYSQMFCYGMQRILRREDQSILKDQVPHEDMRRGFSFWYSRKMEGMEQFGLHVTVYTVVEAGLVLSYSSSVMVM